MFLTKIKNKLSAILSAKGRNRRIKKYRRKIKNTTFSVISSNCVGGVITHDLGVRFNSPFVNLFVDTKDFLKYLKDINEYNKKELCFLDFDGSYPKAKLGDITVHFVHYKSNEEALEKWQTRLQRLNYDNLYIMMTEQNMCTEDDLVEFDNLPYQNKVVFTHKKYPLIKSAFYVKGFEDKGEVGNLVEQKSFLTGKRYYEDFDFVSFFNKGLSK